MSGARTLLWRKKGWVLRTSRFHCFHKFQPNNVMWLQMQGTSKMCPAAMRAFAHTQAADHGFQLLLGFLLMHSWRKDVSQVAVPAIPFGFNSMQCLHECKVLASRLSTTSKSSFISISRVGASFPMPAPNCLFIQPRMDTLMSACGVFGNVWWHI